MSERRREGRRHVAVAVLLSAAFHALVLLAIRGGRVEPAPPGEILDVELREIAPSGGAVAPPGRAEGGPRAPEERPTAEPEERRVREGPLAREESREPGERVGREERRGAPGAPPEAGPPRGADPGEVRRWLDENGLARPGPGADLEFVPPPGAYEAGGGEGGGGGSEDEPPGVRAKRRVDDMIAEMKARDLARYPDASWMEMRDALAEGFAPSFDALREGGSAAGDLLSDAVTAYTDSAGRYGRTGIPYENRPDAPGRAGADADAAARASASGNRDRESLQGGLDALAAAGAGKNLAHPWTRGLGARISAVHDDDGVVLSVRLSQTSGNASYDRLVLEQARKTVGRRFLAFAGSTTEWAYVTDLSVNPPVPSAGVSFDANFKPTGVEYPLKRTVRPLRPELVAVRRREG